MPVTGSPPAERDEKQRQIERLVASSVLHGSESLCKLLKYLAEQARLHPGAPVKEYQIATEVFGRPSYFDPRLDSTVRVQTGRLRSKLAEYYVSAGAEDPVIVEIPKGSYTLTFHYKHVPVTPSYAPVVATTPIAPSFEVISPRSTPNGTAEHDQAATEQRSRLLVVLLIVLSFALLGTVIALSYLLLTRPAVTAKSVPAPEEDTGPLKIFWKGFLEQPEFPWVVFSNAEFVGRPEVGMRYFNPATDSRNDILDHYTGVGEVLGIHELDRVFTQFKHGLRVKRGRLLSLDDAKNNSVIFLGSPSENLSLREIPVAQDFVFRRTDSPGRKGDLAIINVHPRNNEETKVFLASPGIPISEDYSIIAMAPSQNIGHLAVLLAGTTTIGTQAAVEYVSRADTVEDLLLRMTGSKTGPVVPFEAILRVKVTRGVPVDSKIVALHTR